ncbi:helix-turn-helix domain-containing protein [Actinomadura sp. HBU206391]|uniref:helix-turn-helix domain-containing protein n=1 Tax=Actinomadura sp. HBU206391 TaxID=2731692 RepID=UPI001650C644|nr:helix-turn-helix domain-containing protein [Actinomadura sp. HBU206391]MBC6463439.1 helix-turn-helix domain-containing protein [Actinomadura sp. HBU206391]
MAASSEESPADAVDDKISGVREVKSAARTIEPFELLTSRQNRPARLRELTEALNVPRGGLYALLRTLTKHGWVHSRVGRRLPAYSTALGKALLAV